MPKHKDLKRLVRARMEKTGESYTTARSQLIAKKTKKNSTKMSQLREPLASEFAALAGMSDEAVKKATGRDWARWVRQLNRAGAAAMPHRDIAAHIHEKYDVSGWWSQMVAVGYERIRGLRAKGQKRDGRYEVSKSKTIAVPLHDLYEAFAHQRSRARWLAGAQLTVKKSSADKSIRFLCEDGTPLDASFWRKGESKSQVQLQHRDLASKAAADEKRAFWTERLAALTEWLTT